MEKNVWKQSSGNQAKCFIWFRKQKQAFITFSDDSHTHILLHIHVTAHSCLLEMTILSCDTYLVKTFIEINPL